MISPLSHVPHVEVPDLSRIEGSRSQGAGTNFKELLGNVIREVEQARSSAGQLTQQFLSGETEELHSVILATQRAELQFELFQQVRNKVVQAYQEIMRMQV